MKSWSSGTPRARRESQARSPHLLAHTPQMAPHSCSHCGWLPKALEAAASTPSLSTCKPCWGLRSGLLPPQHAYHQRVCSYADSSVCETVIGSSDASAEGWAYGGLCSIKAMWCGACLCEPPKQLPAGQRQLG